MNYLRLESLVLAILFIVPLRAADRGSGQALVWDTIFKKYEASRGETNALFVFQVTNVSLKEVVIRTLRPSCECTIARFPFELPGRLAAGAAEPMEVKVDLRDRWELFQQTIAVETSAGTNRITLEIKPPELTPREKNRLAAFADRQGVFKNACATCHLQPAAGKRIEERYEVLCGICHNAAHRAEMVPDLATTKKPDESNYWEQWVRRGKPGTFMPAFSKPFGGPMTEDEISALVAYLVGRFPAPRQVGPMRN